METTTTLTIEQLIAAGGHRWQKNGNDRIYFNDLAALFGVTTTHYNTGNLNGVWIDGDEISNNKGRQLLVALHDAQVWFDVPTGQWMSRGLGDRAIVEAERYGRDLPALERIVTAIAERAAGENEPMTTPHDHPVNDQRNHVSGGTAMEPTEKEMLDNIEAIHIEYRAIRDAVCKALDTLRPLVDAATAEADAIWETAEAIIDPNDPISIAYTAAAAKRDALRAAYGAAADRLITAENERDNQEFYIRRAYGALDGFQAP